MSAAAKMHRILIKGGTVLSMDDDVGDHEVADIMVESGRIAEIAPSLNTSDADVQIIDAHERIVFPGLIDTHRHTWQSALKHRLGDEDFVGYGCKMLRGIGPLYTPEDIYIGNLLGALSALEAGTTTLLDWSHALNTPEHADAAIAALRDAGIRGIFAQGWSRADGQNWTQNSVLQHNPDVIRVRKNILSTDDALVTHYLAGRGPEMTTTEVVKQDFALARDLGIRISMHVGVRDFGPKFRAVEVMAKAGVLGPDLTLIHLCASSAHEMSLMAEHGVSAAIGPQSEMMIDGAGIPPVGRLLAAGIRPSLSGDTETVGTGDLFTQMRLALACERLLSANGLLPDKVPPVKVRDMLEFATIVGAQACGLEQRTGSLSPGKRADIVLVRATDLNLAPVTDPVGALVLAAHPGNVETVIVDGVVRKRNGSLVGVDLDQVRRRANRSRDSLLERARAA
jgi:cytosine/adenosine deaminase-related metal-dependent hydrolase